MDSLKNIAAELRTGLTTEGSTCPTCGHEDDRDRRRRLYSTMVDRVIERASTELKEVLSREQAINRIAVYEPRIREYLGGSV
jgi:hypothetical protein